MNYGNERFTQYLASNNCSFNLAQFIDKQGVQGYDMSTFIRRYSKYLNEKAVSYRQMAFDFCKVKRGKDDGLLRTMNADKLLKTLPALQKQLNSLLEFDCAPNELTNGVINACFLLMFKDLIRLFACYNDGIINLLEKYFDMNKKQCKDALEIYKRFLVRMDKVSEFLKTAENASKNPHQSVGIDKSDIPDLAKVSFRSMEPFLRKRGVDEDTLRALRDQKIDEDAVRGMTDSDLSEYLPKKGDRFALKDFLTQAFNKPKTRKSSLMDRLRDRLRSSRANSAETCTDDPESTVKKIPKLSAKKEVHKVHLGWYHFDKKKKVYLHVRAKAGGGKRTLMLNKNMNKESIIKECLDLFFPNGKSQHGELKNMEVELTDFQLKPLEDEETTLGDIIDKAKLQFIHFYLRTRLQKQISDDSDDDEKQKEEKREQKLSTISTLPILCNASEKCTESKDEPNEISEGAKKNEEDPKSSISTPSTIPCKDSQQTTESNDKQVGSIVGDEGGVLMKLRSSNPSSADQNGSSPLPDPLFFPVWEDSLEEVAFTHAEPILQTVREPKEFGIIVHRGQVLRELIKIFKDNPDVDFTKDIITATIILPNGEREQAYDSGGVMRDMLTEFWDDFYEQCTTGTNLKVPCLRHDMEAADWKAVRRVIALGWILQKVLPIRLAPNFLKSSLYGIASDRLREEFLQFIPSSESMVLSSALEGMENVEMDELLEILSTHDCKVKVTKDNLGAVIDQIAHLEMVQEPAFIRECLFEVLITYELVMDVEKEFQKITPTSKKLISSLECEELESDSFKYLKRYIREIDTDTRMLRTLLRFLTASDLMLYDSEGIFFKIQVKIVDLEGIARRPIAHTCGRVLDLPRIYESYTVFKAEMNAILNSNIWVMDFA